MATAREILDQRLASGEITEAEYDRLVSKLAAGEPAAKPTSSTTQTDPRTLNLIRQSLPSSVQTAATAEYNALPARTKDFVSEIEYLTEYKNFYDHFENKHNAADKQGLLIGSVIGILVILIGYSKETFVIGPIVGFASYWIISSMIQSNIRSKMDHDIKVRLGSLFQRKADAASANSTQ